MTAARKSQRAGEAGDGGREVPTRETFYASALEAADRHDLAVAREVDGIDDEVALLRLQLRRHLADGGDVDPKLVQSAVRLLMQALLAQHRLSPRQADGLGEALASVLEEFGEVLGTAD